MCAAVVADRGFTWSDEETSALLKFWAAHDPHNNGNKRNFVIYEKISEKMVDLGFNRSTSQCREKIKRMKREYTLTKQFNGNTTGPKKLMRFYDQFERILLEKRLRNQRNTTLRAKALVAAHLDSQGKNQKRRSNVQSRIKSNKTDSSFGKLFPPRKATSSKEKDDENPWAPAVVLIEGDSTSSLAGGSLCHASPDSIDSGLPSKNKRAADIAIFEEMMETMNTKFMNYQEQADSRFLSQLDILRQEQRISEQNIQNMWLEFEERRKTNEEQHELNITNMFQGLLGQVSQKTARSNK